MVNSEQERSSSRSWPQKMKNLDPILYYSFLLVFLCVFIYQCDQMLKQKVAQNYSKADLK